MTYLKLKSCHFVTCWVCKNNYRISSYSFRGRNYSFLNLTSCTVTFVYSTYRCGNYSRAETIWGNTVVGLRLVSPWSFEGYAKFNKSSSWVFDSFERPTKSWSSHGVFSVPQNLERPTESSASHKALSIPRSLERPTVSSASHGVLSVPWRHERPLDSKCFETLHNLHYIVLAFVQHPDQLKKKEKIKILVL